MSNRRKRLPGPVILIWIAALATALSLTEPASAAAELKLRLLEEPRPLPELAFVDAAGGPRHLADFRGKTVLLNIWATWCAPCRKEMPSLDRLQAALGGPDFEVVALSIDQGGVADVEAFYDELGLEHLGIYVDSAGAAMRALRILGVPTTLLVDDEGNELARSLGPDDWDSPAVTEFLQPYLKRTGGRRATGSGVHDAALSPLLD